MSRKLIRTHSIDLDGNQQCLTPAWTSTDLLRVPLYYVLSGCRSQAASVNYAGYFK